jgi:hypothetical protein
LASQTPPNPAPQRGDADRPEDRRTRGLVEDLKPSFAICTYCVAPTSPFVSGGAQLQLTPGNGMPLKFRPALGIAGSASVVCATVSG